jgi:hypothetical protein
MSYHLYKSNLSTKKYMVITPDNKTIHFGGAGYTDFILSGGDEERKKLYIARHQKHENWEKSGINTSGWWSRWILWSKSTLSFSIRDTEKRFNIKIISHV